MKPISYLQRIASARVAQATRAVALALLTVLFLPQAHAFRVAYGPNSGTVTLPNITPSTGFGPGGTGQVSKVAGGVRFASNGTVLFGTAQGTMNVFRDLNDQAAARMMARALPAAAAGVFLYEVATQIRCRGLLPQLDAFLECDGGVAPQTTTVNDGISGNYPNGGVCLTYGESKAACDAWASGAIGVPGSYCERGTGGNSNIWALIRGDNGNVHTTWGTGPCSLEVTGCPNGGTVGPDGLCPGGIWTPASEQAVGQKIEQHPGFQTTAQLEQLAREAVGLGIDPATEASPEQVTGPSTVTGPTTTITETPTGGSPTTTTVQQVHNVTYEGNTYNYTTTTTTVNNQGETVVTEAPEVETCGLPGKPKCLIDETGTPTAPPPDEYPDGGGETLDPLRSIIQNPDVADTSWSWSFSLPSSCGLILTPAFAPFLESIDLCEWQPLIHDLVGLLWIGATIFGSIFLVGRTLGAG